MSDEKRGRGRPALGRSKDELLRMDVERQSRRRQEKREAGARDVRLYLSHEAWSLMRAAAKAGKIHSSEVVERAILQAYGEPK